MKKLLLTLTMGLSAMSAFAHPITVSVTNQFDNSVDRNAIPRSGFTVDNVANHSNALAQGTVSKTYKNSQKVTYLLYMTPAAMKSTDFSNCTAFNGNRCNAVYCYTDPIPTGDNDVTEMQIGIKQTGNTYQVSCRVNQIPCKD